MKNQALLWVGSIVLAGGSIALADEIPTAPAPAPVASQDCRLAVIPAHNVWVERQVATPPVTTERRVPVYATEKVPVFESRLVPEYRDVEEPIYETRQSPVIEERQVPVYGPVAVPVYEERDSSFDLSLPNPFGCDDLCLSLPNPFGCDEVQVGTAVQQGVVGTRPEAVQTGVRQDQVQVGTQPRRVLVGQRTEVVKTGERDEQRIVGWRNETIVVRPAEMRTVRECVLVPEQRVTVGPQGSAPLAGTNRILTEDEYMAALAAAR
jgi:hypothetical protein